MKSAVPLINFEMRGLCLIVVCMAIIWWDMGGFCFSLNNGELAVISHAASWAKLLNINHTYVVYPALQVCYKESWPYNSM